MPASDRYSLIVESTTRGESSLRAFEQSLNRVVDVAERAQKRTGDIGKGQGSAINDFAARVRAGIENPLSSAGSAVESFLQSAGKIGLIGGAIAAGLGVAAKASFALVSSLGDAAEGLINLSDRTGLTVNQLDKLQAMGRVAGVSIDSLAQASKSTVTLLGDLGIEGEEARKTLAALGVRFYEVTGAQRASGLVLDEIITKLGGIENQTQRFATAQKALGRAAIELQPLIKNYAELDRVAREAGFGNREALLKSLADTADQIDILGLKWEALKAQFSRPARAVVEITTAVAGALIGAPRGPGDPVTTFRPAGVDVRAPLAVGAGPAPDVGAGFVAGNQAAARAAQSAFLLTNAGSQQRIGQIDTELARLRASLFSGDLAQSARESISAQIRAFESEKAAAEARIEAANEARSEAKRLATFRAEPISTRARRVPTLRKSGDAQFSDLLRDQSDLLPLGPLAGGAFVARPIDTAFDDRAFGAGLLEREKQSRTRLLEAQKSDLEFQSRRVALLTGPAGEVAAINRITEIKLRQVEIEAQLNESLDLRAEKSKILQEKELQLLSLQRQQLDQFKRFAGEAFSASVTRGGGGILDIARSQVVGLGRTLTENLAGEAFSAVRGRVTIPGQRDSEGNPTVLGRLFAGTPFADSGLKSATQLNTLATVENTTALRGLSAASASRIAGTVSGVSQSISVLSGVRGGSTLGLAPVGPGGVVTGGAGDSVPSLSIPTAGVGTSVPGVSAVSAAGSGGFLRQYGSTAQTAAVYAAATAGAAIGVYSGIKEGGARGGLRAASAGLGAAAAFDPEPVSKAILTIAAIGTGLLSAAINPKGNRAKEIEQIISGAKFSGPESEVFGYTSAGNGFDFGIDGRLRPIVIQVSAMDSRSFADHASEIADAVQSAMMRGGHPIGAAMREVVAS